MNPIRVPVDELSFEWRHKPKPSHCVILHGDKVVKRGCYREMSELFFDITEENPESTVAVQYEEAMNETRTDQQQEKQQNTTDH